MARRGAPTRFLAVFTVAFALVAPSCAVEPDEGTTPSMTVDEEFLDELNRDVERRMDEMMRENQELVDSITGDEPLRGLAP